MRLLAPGFFLSCLLAVTCAATGDAAEVDPIPLAPELVHLDQELTGAQKAKEQGAITHEKYREFRGRIRANLDAVKPRIPSVPADTALHARILSRLGEGAQAASNLTQALEEEPGNADLRMALGQVRYEGATRQLLHSVGELGADHMLEAALRAGERGVHRVGIALDALPGVLSLGVLGYIIYGVLDGQDVKDHQRSLVADGAGVVDRALAGHQIFFDRAEFPPKDQPHG